MSDSTEMELYFKKEFLQHTGRYVMSLLLATTSAPYATNTTTHVVDIFVFYVDSMNS